MKDLTKRKTEDLKGSKKEVKQITAEQLQNLDNDVRTIILDYMLCNGNMTTHAFAKLSGVHPNQVYLFLNGDRGLNLTTVQKIGEVINK